MRPTSGYGLHRGSRFAACVLALASSVACGHAARTEEARSALDVGDAECARDEQLEPAVAQQDETGDRTAEREGDGGADHGVEPRRTAQEARLAGDL